MDERSGYALGSEVRGPHGEAVERVSESSAPSRTTTRVRERFRLAFFGVKYFPSRGGASRVIESVIRNLKDEYDITIYCYRHPEAERHLEGVNVIQFKEVPIKGLGVFIYFIKCYFHVMFKGNYDLLHVCKIDAAVFLPLLSLKYPRILATSHESPYTRDKWGPIARMYFKIGERIFVRSKAALSVVSAPLSLYYKERYDRDVAFIPNGVEPLTDVGRPGADALLKKHAIKKPYISFAARRIMSTKGAHTMLGALQLMQAKEDIVIAGELGHADGYLTQLEALATGLSVKLVGYIEDKATLLDLIRQSEIFIFPSETEGMSIMLLEVALEGIPIIASDIPENTSVFDESEVSFFSDRNVDDLAEKLSWFRAHRELAKEKALRAREKVLTRYSDAAMAESHRVQYRKLLAT